MKGQEKELLKMQKVNNQNINKQMKKPKPIPKVKPPEKMQKGGKMGKKGC